MGKQIFSLLATIILLSITESVFAQCPMCRAAVETATESGSSVGLGLNAGILYLLMMPYLLFSAIFFFWYRNYKRMKAEERRMLEN